MAVQNVMASGNSTNVFALLDRWFYFGMSLLIAVIAMYGFGQTIDRNLIHPTVPRPFYPVCPRAAFRGLGGCFYRTDFLGEVSQHALA